MKLDCALSLGRAQGNERTFPFFARFVFFDIRMIYECWSPRVGNTRMVVKSLFGIQPLQECSECLHDPTDELVRGLELSDQFHESRSYPETH